MDKNIGNNFGKNISSDYSQKLLYHGKWSATDALKTYSKDIYLLKKEKKYWWSKSSIIV